MRQIPVLYFNVNRQTPQPYLAIQEKSGTRAGTLVYPVFVVQQTSPMPLSVTTKFSHKQI